MKQVRCDYCGKFISYKDIHTSPRKVRSEYIPLSEFTRETIKFWHVKCE